MKFRFKSQPAPKEANGKNLERQKALEARKAGDAARDLGSWLEAIDHYQDALKHGGPDRKILIQYGNMLKEAQQLDMAIGAYKQALDLDDTDPDVLLQLGHAYKLAGHKPEAIDAYARSLEIDPGFALARDELIVLGARDRLPSNITGRTSSTRNLARLHHLIEEGVKTAGTLGSLATYPLENYDLFRRHFPIQPPPGSAEQETVVVLIDAIGLPAFALRETLRSLQDQRHASWQAFVRSSPDMADHPVASMALEDSRIVFDPELERIGFTDHPLVILDAGTLLDREALGWMVYASQRAQADLLYADHDLYAPHWQYGLLRSEPVLQPMFDPDDMANTPWPPSVLLVQAYLAANARDLICRLTGVSLRRALLTLPDAGLRRAHLPRILSSRREDLSEPNRPSQDRTEVQAEAATDAGRILVVIPTRDEPDMLASCVRSLKQTADQPERVHIILVNNRSQSESRTRFEALRVAGDVQILDVDEPFNWSRINNLAVRSALSDGQAYDVLVFANNDVEALSQGWDSQLVSHFQHPEIGVVGAQLHYPDGTLQHGGILLGGHLNRPLHDGIHRPAGEAGPLERLQRQRGVAAVTGAFMAISPALFGRTGGFDPGLAVAYNDVDFCLKARAEGYRVVYDPGLKLIHHESVTRGSNLTPDKIAWDDSELASLHDRWEDWLFFDPTRNPHWTSSHERPFDGLQDLTLSQVLEHLDRSARPRPSYIDLNDNRSSHELRP